MHQQQMFRLDKNNYHSKEADQHYMSVSQFKRFIECEARALAELKGEFTRPHSSALLVGSYTHAAFESNEAFAEFCEKERDSIYKARGGKYSEYEKADEMIDTLKKDPFAMFALQGQKEVILTGEFGGVQWKIKADNINLERNFFSDLKTTKSLYDRYWSSKYGDKWVSFVHHYGYILQMTLYQEIIRQHTGNLFTPYVVAVTKESPPDKAILEFSASDLEFEIEYLKVALPVVMAVKNGERAPERCEKCEYCRGTKVLKNTLNINFLLD